MAAPVPPATAPLSAGNTGAMAFGDSLQTTIGSEVLIDANAAGYGWSLGQQVSPNKVDLRTVIEHELGHVLGLADIDAQALPGDLMDETLPVGVRRSPSACDIHLLQGELPDADAVGYLAGQLSPHRVWRRQGSGMPIQQNNSSGQTTASLSGLQRRNPAIHLLQSLRPNQLLAVERGCRTTLTTHQRRQDRPRPQATVTLPAPRPRLPDRLD